MSFKDRIIYYNNVSDLCSFMKQDKNKILDWWYSKDIQNFRLVLLDELCKNQQLAKILIKRYIGKSTQIKALQ